MVFAAPAGVDSTSEVEAKDQAAREGPPRPSDEPPELTWLDSPDRFAERSPWVRRPFVVEVQGSFGGPLGLVGLAFDTSVRRELSVSLGAGYEARTQSPRVAAMMRLRLPVTSHFATGAEGGLAYGQYDDGVECDTPRCHPSFHWDHAVIGYSGLILELRTPGGLSLRWSFGAGAIFNLSDAHCDGCSATAEPNLWLTTIPYTGVAVGRALPW